MGPSTQSGTVYSLYTGFSVYTPKSFTAVGQGAPGIQYSTKAKQWLVGMLPTATSPSGVTWVAAVFSPPGFADGQFRFVQMVNPVRSFTRITGGAAKPNLHRFWGLDTSDPYDDPVRFNASEGWRTDGTLHIDGDTPARGIDATIFKSESLQDSFKTYLMYRPPGDNSGWVPLMRDDWSYAIAVQQITATLPLAGGKTTKPYYTGDWSLVGKPWQNVPQFVRETQEPVWTFIHNAANLF